ncbi:MAG: TROVE domain-containing protein [Bacteroidia bacterium]
MSKFNKKKEPVIPTTVNDMGEKAFKLEAKEALVATSLTTFLANGYYETETEITKRIKSDIKKVDPLFVAKLAVYLRQEANMRSVSHLIAGELSSVTAEWKTNFYKKVLVRPDDMAEILANYIATNAAKNAKGKAKIPNAMKKAFKAKLESMDPYLIDKYKMKNRDFKLIDLVNLFRPEPTSKNAEAYKRLMKGESLEGLYTSKIFEKEMSKAGQITPQSTLTVDEAKVEAIEDVLGNVKGMPIFNLLRNLRNILEIAPHMVSEACSQLTNPMKVENSRLLPFRFATAYNEIVILTKDSGVAKTKGKSITFEKDTKTKLSEYTVVEFNAKKEEILNALETALEYSVKNIPGLEGNVAILIDHSGSVRGDGGGSSKLSAFGKTTHAMVGNLFGSMLAWRQDNVYIGNFGDNLISVPVDRKQRMLDFNKKSFDEGSKCGGGTENGLYIFLDNCIKEKTKVDYLCIFSDMVIGSGGIGGWDRSSNARLGTFQDLFKSFKALNPQCKTICVDIKQTKGTSVFDKSLQVLQVAGWSDKIFETIKANCIGYKELIAQIDAIVI